MEDKPKQEQLFICESKVTNHANDFYGEMILTWKFVMVIEINDFDLK